ncbi:MAG: cell division protein ZapA [Candidatus Accumulibacter sp.]|jgi:cell division protein ZapA|nr:cell division protein ZapA [Accumulibacter sp.]
MSSDAHHIDITLLGKEYRVACPEGEEDTLRRVAAVVDGRMREIATKKTRNSGERIAVMVALNVTHELLALQDQFSGKHRASSARDDEGAGVDFDAIKRRITLMEARLDAVFEPQDTLI